MFRISTGAKIFGLVGMLIELVALVMLFTGPGNTWFRRTVA